jgi:hypothetical protein
MLEDHSADESRIQHAAHAAAYIVLHTVSCSAAIAGTTTATTAGLPRHYYKSSGQKAWP